jgi:hypothetical protein
VKCNKSSLRVSIWFIIYLYCTQTVVKNSSSQAADSCNFIVIESPSSSSLEAIDPTLHRLAFSTLPAAGMMFECGGLG